MDGLGVQLAVPTPETIFLKTPKYQYIIRCFTYNELMRAADVYRTNNFWKFFSRMLKSMKEYPIVDVKIRRT